jgi:hypothetical protein
LLIDLFAQANPANALAPTAGTSAPGEFEEEARFMCMLHDIIHKYLTVERL